MNEVLIPAWYAKPGSDRKVKALLCSESNGYATIALESGKIVVDHIEYLTLDDAAGVFEQCEWMDGEN